MIRLTGTHTGARMGARLAVRPGRGDAGSSLLLALAFLSLFGVAVATLLSFADTSMLATIAVRNQRSNVSATEGAMHLAINAVRNSLALGVDPATTGGVNTCTVPAIGLNSVTPTVACAGQAGSGFASATVSNAPQNAILALGTSSSDGVYFLKSDASPTTVGGSVLSSSQISALSTELDVTGSVTAASCSGSIVVKGSGSTSNCASTTVFQDPGLTDTTYALPVSSPPAAGVVPACTGGTATFSPGTYTNPSALSSCARNVFTPGVYYFNFPSSNPVWNVNSVIGGTLAPGGLTCDSSKPGVEFIFGGQSSVVVGDGATFILCASPNASSQQIALYGVGHPVTLAATTLGSSSNFTNPANGLALGGTGATAALTTATPQVLSAVETVQGFTPTIPSGSTITSAVVRVRHYESGSSSGSGTGSGSGSTGSSSGSTGSSSGSVTLNVVATPGGGSAVTLPAASSCTASTAPYCDWTSADLGPSGTGILATPAAISGLTVAWSATISGSNQTATENLDGIVLDVTYAPTGFTPQVSNCGGGAPWGCSLVTLWQTSSSTPATFAVTGTLYAPLTSVLMRTLSPSSSQFFTRGTVVRSALFTLQFSGATGAILVNTAKLGIAANRTVLFSVSISGVTKLQSLVTFDDSIVGSPGATVTVKSWNVSR